MKITFINNDLEKYANNKLLCAKKLGAIRAKLYFKRLRDLLAANNLEEVRRLPGHYHELIGDRKGQWACDLDQPYRLIFQPNESPIPKDKDGRYIWVEIKGIEIIKIENYHGK